MNGFGNAKLVEKRGLDVLLPLVKERSYDGQFVVMNKGALARYLQEIIGDVIFNSDPDRLYTVEIKVEAEYRPNLFLELYSNRNLDDRRNHAERGMNVGWMFKQRADLLFYYFLDTDDLYVISFFRLQQWAFGSGDEPGKIWNFEQKRQRKWAQLNDTWGACVPIKQLPPEIYRRLKARQISLFTTSKWTDADF